MWTISNYTRECEQELITWENVHKKLLYELMWTRNNYMRENEQEVMTWENEHKK